MTRGKRCSRSTYRTRRVARREGRIIADRYGLRFRVYRCEGCRRWHLTTSYVPKLDEGGQWPHPKPDARTLKELVAIAAAKRAASTGSDGGQS